MGILEHNNQHKADFHAVNINQYKMFIVSKIFPAVKDGMIFVDPY